MAFSPTELAEAADIIMNKIREAGNTNTLTKEERAFMEMYLMAKSMADKMFKQCGFHGHNVNNKGD